MFLLLQQFKLFKGVQKTGSKPWPSCAVANAAVGLPAIIGVSTPETRRGQAKCEIERELGKQVSAWVREKLPKGPEVTPIWEGRREKYGRLLSASSRRKVSTWPKPITGLAIGRRIFFKAQTGECRLGSFIVTRRGAI